MESRTNGRKEIEQTGIKERLKERFLKPIYVMQKLTVFQRKEKKNQENCIQKTQCI